MDFAEQIKSLAALARANDTDLLVFGARSHKYEFNPVIGIDKVREFESELGMPLPDAYVQYLTQVGNGGAGPNYGLYPLEKVKGFYNPDEEIFMDKKCSAEQWEEICLAYDESLNNDDDEDNEYQRIEQRMLNGSIIIGTPGCTMYTVLMCKGENYGKIGIVDLDMVEECVPKISDKTFEEWIIGYFRKIAGI